MTGSANLVFCYSTPPPHPTPLHITSTRATAPPLRLTRVCMCHIIRSSFHASVFSPPNLLFHASLLFRRSFIPQVFIPQVFYPASLSLRRSFTSQVFIPQTFIPQVLAPLSLLLFTPSDTNMPGVRSQQHTHQIHTARSPLFLK